MPRLTALSLLVVVAVQGPILLPLEASAQTVSADDLSNLEFRHIGPVGNRISAVHGITGDPLTYYAGAAAGGLWKSEDGGLYWEPLFDDQDAHAIGSIDVAESDPEIVWVGTGEPHIRSNVSIGDGVYRSQDGGETWEHMGLDATGRISKVRIHPSNPDIVYIAALGHVHSPQPERGIFRTMDGGETWEHVLFVDEAVGASDLVMDPNNPRILFTGMWTVEFNTWGRRSGGPLSGIYVSRDAGDTWTRLEGNGLPRRPVGKIGLCMTPADSDRIYALIETGDGVPWEGQATDSGELWRSDDGGGSWQLMTHNRNFGGRTGYYNNCRVLPDDPDEAMFLTAAFTRTIDGGRTGTALTGRSRPGGDYHDLWIDPTNPDRWLVGNDQGVSVSINRGESWLRTQLPVAQMYHVTVDNAVPYNVLGNRQDGPSFRGPSNSLYGGFGGGSIPRGDWHAVGGGESGFATPDPTDPNVVWSSASGSGARGGIVVRYDETNRQFRNVEVWPESTGGWPAEELRYRFQWTFPLLISPHDNNTVYVTSQHVHRTTNGGQSWEVISPDLTTNDKSRQGISGGLTPDNIGVEYCCVIYAFDESPTEEGVFFAGSNDGLVHVSRDGGANWENVTENLPELPPDGVVRGIDISRHEAGKAFLAIEHHQVGNFEPHVYRTRDYGQTWTKIVAGIEDHPLSYTRSIHEDPVRNGLVYLGTENRLYVSFNDGDEWMLLKNNLPPAPMYGIVVQEHFNDLVLGTYGRGFWILDDVTPLQQMSEEVAASDLHLFQPRDAYRFHNRTNPQVPNVDMSQGENPEYGASINYWLGAPADEVTVRIADSAGDVVRTLNGPGSRGINRVVWDLESEGGTEVRMRTTPLYAEWVDLGPDRMRIRGQGPEILLPPGTYTVTLEVNGERQSRDIEVLKDPNSAGTVEDIRAQTAMMRDIGEDYNAAADAINQIEWIRRQLYDLTAVMEERQDAAEAVAAAEALDARLIAVEEELVQLRTTGTGQDGVRYPAKLIGKLGHLANGVMSADFRPTDQQGEVHQVLKEILRDAQGELQAILSTDLAAFNDMLERLGAGRVIAEDDLQF